MSTDTFIDTSKKPYEATNDQRRPLVFADIDIRTFRGVESKSSLTIALCNACQCVDSCRTANSQLGFPSLRSTLR